jgi:hypothetical protein
VKIQNIGWKAIKFGENNGEKKERSNILVLVSYPLPLAGRRLGGVLVDADPSRIVRPERPVGRQTPAAVASQRVPSLVLVNVEAPRVALRLHFVTVQVWQFGDE